MSPESLVELHKDLLLLEAIPPSGYGQTVIIFKNGKIERIDISNQILVQR